MSQAPNHTHERNINERAGPIAVLYAMGGCVRRRMAHKPHLTRLGARRHDLWHSDRRNPAGLPNSEPDRREKVGETMWNAVATGSRAQRDLGAPTRGASAGS
jgi:hypothetical protein